MNTDLILINGDIVDRKEGLIEYCDRGHQFGDGVFEIVPVYNGKVFGMIPHMENLFTSVTRLKIPAVYMVEELVEFHEALIKATGMENGEIYTQVTRGSAPFGLAFRNERAAACNAACFYRPLSACGGTAERCKTYYRKRPALAALRR